MPEEIILGGTELNDQSHNLKQYSAGAFRAGLFNGETVGYAVNFLCDRAKLSPDHVARRALPYYRCGDTREGVDRLPEVFPPTDYPGKLISVQDWLDCIDNALATTRIVKQDAETLPVTEPQILPADQNVSTEASAPEPQTLPTTVVTNSFLAAELANN